jgi:hypothetical protein
MRPRTINSATTIFISLLLLPTLIHRCTAIYRLIRCLGLSKIIEIKSISPRARTTVSAPTPTIKSGPHRGLIQHNTPRGTELQSNAQPRLLLAVAAPAAGSLRHHSPPAPTAAPPAVLLRYHAHVRLRDLVLLLVAPFLLILRPLLLAVAVAVPPPLPLSTACLRGAILLGAPPGHPQDPRAPAGALRRQGGAVAAAAAAAPPTVTPRRQGQRLRLPQHRRRLLHRPP